MNEATGLWVCGVAIAATLLFAAWVSFFADCHSIAWLPVQNLPGRCLTVVR